MTGKKRKLLQISILAALMGSCLIVGACKGEDKKDTMKVNFGASVDGVAMTGDWKFAKDSFSTQGSKAESTAFTKTMLSDYSFSYLVKVDETATDGDAVLGAYAYYMDMDNYVKYSVNPAENTITIKWSQGFDSEERTNEFDQSVDFSDYVAFKVEKIGTQFKFLINGEIVQSRVYDFEDSVQVGFVNNYLSASYKDYKFEELSEFSEAEISMKEFEQLARDAEGYGTWELKDGVITNDCSKRWESYLFEGQATNMALDLDFTRTGVDGNEPLAGVSVYLNSANWCSFFFSPTHAEVYLCEKTYQGWTGGGEIDYDETKPVNVRLEKMGSRVQFIVNGKLFKAFDSDTFTNAMFAIETKHTQQEIKINEFAEIDEFSVPYDFALMPKTNLTGEYVDDMYVFNASTGGLWGGETVSNPSFEGGLHVALGNVMANDYTFETIVTLSKDETANGLVGVVAFWHFTGNCLFYLIDSATGDIDVGGSVITGTWANQKRNVTDFGLTLEDEIPIKVVKKAGAFTFYVNGQEATKFTHAYYSVQGSFGYCGTSPMNGSGKTGQYGATFSCTRFKTDGYSVGYGENDHRFTAWKTETAAGCETTGKEVRTCYDCGETEERITPKLGHDEGTWKVEKYPTATEEGLRINVCGRCEETVASEVIPVKSMVTSFSEESKENFAYSFKAVATKGEESDYFGGYAFYQDEGNNLLFKINPSSEEMQIIFTANSVETSVFCKVGSIDAANGTFVKVERMGKEFRFVVNGKLVYVGEFDVEGAAKVATAYEYTEITLSEVTLTDVTNFSSEEILFGYNESAYAINGTGTQGSEGNVITSDCTSERAWYLFNYNDGQKPMGAMSDFSVSLTAENLSKNEAKGADPRAAMCVYANSSYWFNVYVINPDGPYVMFYGNLGADEGWFLASEKGYYVPTPNYTEGAPMNLKVEKLGDTFYFFVNGTFVRSFSDPALATAWVGVETKHSAWKYTVNEYKTIDEFSSVEHKLFVGMNMTTTYADGIYTFAESTDGYWTGELPCFDGGAMHIGFVNATALAYTFETKIKLSDKEGANGITGVMGFWFSGSRKSWLEITEDGIVNVWGIDGVGYLGEKQLSEFGLTTADEISVKVVKTATKIAYYIGDTLAYELESNYFNTYGHFGFHGTTGQFGATYQIVSVKHN